MQGLFVFAAWFLPGIALGAFALGVKPRLDGFIGERGPAVVVCAVASGLLIEVALIAAALDSYVEDAGGHARPLGPLPLCAFPAALLIAWAGRITARGGRDQMARWLLVAAILPVAIAALATA